MHQVVLIFKPSVKSFSVAVPGHGSRVIVRCSRAVIIRHQAILPFNSAAKIQNQYSIQTKPTTFLQLRRYS